MKKNKKSDKLSKTKLSKEIESAFSKRAESLVYEEIKKSIMENPALMNQLAQMEKGVMKSVSDDSE